MGWNDAGALVGAMYTGAERGKHGPVRMAIGLTPEGKVFDLAVMEYQEVRGRPVRRKSYLKQYLGKSHSDPVRLGDDIRGLTGASYSSRAVTTVVKQAVVLLQVLYVNRNK
jgi:Na+-translocating ferredoxin:NAD+ oxidoreductase RnfG subunit